MQPHLTQGMMGCPQVDLLSWQTSLSLDLSYLSDTPFPLCSHALSSLLLVEIHNGPGSRYSLTAVALGCFARSPLSSSALPRFRVVPEEFVIEVICTGP